MLKDMFYTLIIFSLIYTTDKYQNVNFHTEYFILFDLVKAFNSYSMSHLLKNCGFQNI